MYFFQVNMTGEAQVAGEDAVRSIVEDWARERPELDTSPLQVLARLHRAYLRYSVQIARQLEQHGLTMAGFDVLTALRRAGAPYRLTAGELAAAGLISSAGVTLRIDRLEKEGLLTRVRDSQDRRVVRCELTDKGLRLIDEVFSEHLDNEQRMLAGLSERERTRLADLLAKLELSLAHSQDEQGEQGS